MLAIIPVVFVGIGWARANRLTPLDRSAVRIGYVVGVVLFLGVFLSPLGGGWRDASAYYNLGVTDPYRVAYDVGGVRYAPPFFQAVEPLRWLSWPEFLLLWSAAELAALWLIAGPVAALVLLVPIVAIEAWYANINLLLALVVTWGFRWPALWSLVLLTKITPGVGLVWFAARREWRNLGVALGATAGIAAVSLLVSPELWTAWLAALGSGAPPGRVADVVPLPVRVVLAALVIAWGGVRDKPWTVPLGAAVAMPVLWPATLSVLVALVPLVRRPSPGRRRRAVDWAVRSTGDPIRG